MNKRLDVVNNQLDVVNAIFSFLLEMGIDNAIFKLKIKRILSKDSKYIDKIFYRIKNTDDFTIIYQFLYYNIFTDKEFFSTQRLTEKERQMLWDSFEKYIKSDNIGIYQDSDFKEKLISCVEYHNSQITNKILGYKEQLIHGVLNRYNKSVEDFENIINTLSQDYTYIGTNEEDFLLTQIESIMKTYRYDINNLMETQKRYFYGIIIILVVLSITIPFALIDINMYGKLGIILFMFVMSVVIIMLARLIFNLSSSIKKIEHDLEEHREELWKVHYNRYEKLLNGLNKEKM